MSMSLTGSRFSSDSAPRALPSWDSKTRWNNLWRDLAAEVTAGSSGHTNSPHPSSREGHHSTARWSSSFLLSHFDPAQSSSRCDLPGPPERGAVNPHAVHDHCQPTCQRHDRLLHPAMPGNLHRPGFEPGPFLRPQHALSCFIEHDPHHLISAARYSAVPIDLARLILGARQLKHGPDFSNRPFRVKHFQTVHLCGVDVARRLALLFGIGTRALPSWDSKIRWNNLWHGLAVR